MWTVNRSEEFFNNGIVTMTGGFKRRAIMPETRVVTLRQLKGDRKNMAITWGPLNSIMVRGKSVDISEDTINRMLYGSEYTGPASVGLFEGKHDTVTRETEMEVQSSRERVLRWIARQIVVDGEKAVWVTGTPILITKASLSFPTKVWLIDRWGEAFRLTQASKIKDVANHLFGVKFGAVGSLAVVPHVPIDIPDVNRGPEQGESSQPSTEAPLPSASISQAPNTEEFKSQLAEMRAQVAKLVENPVQGKSGKRKHKAGESDEELSAELSKEERKQQKKDRRASKKEAREKETLEQQRRDAVLAGASGSGAPAPVSGSQLDHLLSYESAPVDKGVNVDPDTDA
uniref:Integrase core domain containing protein n=1 Tax=Solanum tuberosum TaxID=4113 RepID=M1DX99_SOLTU